MNKLLLSIIIFLPMSGYSKNLNIISLDHLQKPVVRKEIRIPDILGYQTLKCDFHIHTMFSDALVWPEYRVIEAWEEGLDAIALTDHIEYRPSKNFLGEDHNAGYELALPKAIEKNILLVKGGEITRSMPPGHLNALFLKDVNLLDVDDVMDVIYEAKKQGAVLVWNHPGGREPELGNCRWFKMHQELYEQGLINGIEVFNKKEWYPTALNWCLDKDLSVMCNSDTHDIIAHYYDIENGHRPMTLVLAKERSLESIKEAILEKRTIAFFDGKLAGKEEYLKMMFEKCVEVRKVKERDSSLELTIENKSDIPFYLQPENKINNSIFIPVKRKIRVIQPKAIGKYYCVRNLYVKGDANLRIEIDI